MDEPVSDSRNQGTGEIFPWADVDAIRENRQFQRHYPKRAAQRAFGGAALACPTCGLHALKHTWFYFESPEWTWERLCGRAGWMTVCDACHRQVNFFLDKLN
jgi:hypothetical protein